MSMDQDQPGTNRLAPTLNIKTIRQLEYHSRVSKPFDSPSRFREAKAG